MKPLSVYLSSRFARIDELKTYRASLERAGFVCTSQWLDGDQGGPEVMSVIDRDDVERSDVIVCFTDEPVEHSPYPFASRGGRHVEFGIGIASGLELVVCGPRESIFCWLPDVTVCSSWSQVLDHLAELRAADEIGDGE